MIKPTTVHTSRTLMYQELSDLMSFGKAHGEFKADVGDNVIDKRSRSNEMKTLRYLKQLYGMDGTQPLFAALMRFWDICDEEEKRLLALQMAVTGDHLLNESVDVILSVPLGAKASIELLEAKISKTYPDRFSKATLRSTAQNIASSWKQAGFIEGKVKNIRVARKIGFRNVAFGIFLGYLEGLRGEYLLHHSAIKCLGLGAEELQHLLHEASKRDIIRYQNVGGVVVISISDQHI